MKLCWKLMSVPSYLEIQQLLEDFLFLPAQWRSGPPSLVWYPQISPCWEIFSGWAPPSSERLGPKFQVASRNQVEKSRTGSYLCEIIKNLIARTQETCSNRITLWRSRMWKWPIFAANEPEVCWFFFKLIVIFSSRASPSSTETTWHIIIKLCWNKMSTQPSGTKRTAWCLQARPGW